MTIIGTMKRTALFLPEPIAKALKALAKRTDISVAEHIRRAIEAYLKKYEETK